MQKFKQFSIIALVMLSIFFTVPFAIADVTGGNKTITGYVNSSVYGNNSDIVPASSDNSAVYENHLTIDNNGNVTGNTMGGFTRGGGDVYKNTVTINNGGVTRQIYGGQAGRAGNVTYNTVTIKSGGTANNIHGGASYGGYVAYNDVIIEYGGTGNYVYGGYTSASIGTINANTVSVSGTVNWVYGGWSVGSNVEYNIVTITSTGIVTNHVYGGTSFNSNSTGNSVNVSGKALNVYGGLTNNTGYVADNKVEISGTVTYAYGGYAMGFGSVSGNSVTVSSGGTVNNSVFGGRINSTSSLDSVSNNTVTIEGKVNNEVYGGFTAGTGIVTNNTVTIENTAILTASTSLWGSNISGVVGTGNTLHVNGFSGSIDTMGNFEYYNFVLGALTNLTFIDVTGAAADIDNSYITIDFGSAFLSNSLSASDQIIVISNITANASPNSVTVLPSSFVAYDYTATYDTGALLLTVNSVGLQPQTKAFGEGFAAGLAFLGQAADLRSNLYFLPEYSGFTPFATMTYGSQYISTGSSVKVKGFSALAGLALNNDLSNGDRLTMGVFFEGGWGDYNSRNSFSNSARVKGTGDTEYYGGGLLARYAMASGLYSEGIFAVGKTETDFKTRDFTSGTTSKYDYSVPYYSANLTLGKVLSLNNMLDFDIYGKYLWTRQTGDNVTVDGYRFKFKDADSHRMRVGGKLKADVSPQLQPYIGGAYEYEFSGKIKGSLYGMNLDEPSLRGSTGIGELGLVWTPTDAQNLKVDLGMQGYAGKREGLSGGLTVSLSF